MSVLLGFLLAIYCIIKTIIYLTPKCDKDGGSVDTPTHIIRSLYVMPVHSRKYIYIIWAFYVMPANLTQCLKILLPGGVTKMEEVLTTPT